jgi:hypothetical protein
MGCDNSTELARYIQNKIHKQIRSFNLIAADRWEQACSHAKAVGPLLLSTRLEEVLSVGEGKGVDAEN